MKKSFVFWAICAASGIAAAQDVGRVLSSTPVFQQVAVPRQICSTQQVEVQAPKSGAGALMGAIAGGAAGNAVGGRGTGQAAATMLGIVGGAILGDRIEGSPEPQLRNVQQCSTQTFYENRTAAYNVVYEFGGKQYSVQLPNDPGPTIALQVSPVGMSPPVAQAPAPAPQVRYVQPEVVTIAQPVYPVYPVYYPRPYYPPVTFQWGYGGWGHGHHWR
jgi:uncharacterized protein YcfJ